MIVVNMEDLWACIADGTNTTLSVNCVVVLLECQTKQMSKIGVSCFLRIERLL